MTMEGEGKPPRVLVSAASKHGATAEIGRHLASALAERGLDTTFLAPEEVTDLDDYGAVVLGSAVYAGHWLDDARALADRIARAQPSPMVWLFSSGPVGDPPKPEEDPVDVADIFQKTAARGHQIFAGRIDRSRLSFGEKAIMLALRAPEGDFRDWEAIGGWAEEIGAALGAGSPAG